MADPVTRLNAALQGRYRIERQLGEGGMSTVYLAKDIKHNRPVSSLFSVGQHLSGGIPWPYRTTSISTNSWRA